MEDHRDKLSKRLPFSRPYTAGAQPQKQVTGRRKKKELEPKLLPKESLLLSITIESAKAHFGFVHPPTLFE